MTTPRFAAYRSDTAMALVGLLPLLAFIDTLFDYFWSGNGIHGTEGALLVVVSTLLLALAAGVVINRWGPAWLRIVLELLIALDLIGTLAAGYLLEAWILVALMLLAALAWVIHLIRRPHRSLAMQG